MEVVVVVVDFEKKVEMVVIWEMEEMEGECEKRRGEVRPLSA